MRIVEIAVILLLLTATTTGCANLLESSVEYIADHESTPFEHIPVEQIIVSDFDEFRAVVLELVTVYEESTTIQYHGTDTDDIQARVADICQEILQSDPITAYAASSITASASRIVSYFEINIEIEFKRTHEQLQAIVDASTQRYMITQLLEKMSQYEEEAVFLTNLQLDREEIIAQVTELYYQNPNRIVMMPFVTVEVYPEAEAEDNSQQPGAEAYKVYEIRFGYTEDTEMLRSMGENLGSSVRRNAARADGDTDGEILLSLAQNLIAGAVYDAGIAETIAMHGQQNIAVTAFGALVQGNAAGEGFAMAFKALCDELRLDCRVVLGYLEDTYHAWNIVLLDGSYYHIDTAICALNGPEAGFLKTDEDFFDMMYTWNTETAPRCNGTMTLDDLLPPEDPEDPDSTGDPEDPDNPEGDPENPDDTGGEGDAGDPNGSGNGSTQDNNTSGEEE